MAGITGIIIKNEDFNLADYETAFKSMFEKLSFIPSQLGSSQVFRNAVLGNVMPISEKENTCFIENKTLGICIFIEGLVFFDEKEKNLLSQKYNVQNFSHANQWLPLFFHCYGEDFISHLTGTYNVVVYEEKTDTVLLFNDRLGYLPLFFLETGSCFLFSSKIESILASGLMPYIRFDHATFAEHLLFNYPISENTYIQNISTLTNATKFKFSKGKIHRKKYWGMESFFDRKSINYRDSIESLNSGLKYALNKATARYDGSINFSLTGGWDSRVVLSYLLPEFLQRLNTYSFGAANSSDILIPQEIAIKEKIKYTPYILDEEYLKESFLQQALDTIKLSNGTRGYKRAHYLYAISKISKISGLVVTGIFGDEVFKVAQAAGGEVLSRNTINFLESDFNVLQLLESLSQHNLFNYQRLEKKDMLPILNERLQHVCDYMSHFDSISQKYYVLRFEYNLRKYFGHEANSYNDFVLGFSPFIDHDFLEVFSKTEFFGTRFQFNTNSLRLKKQTTRLYYEITNANYPALTRYNSGRGYSMADVSTLYGQFKILYSKYFNKKRRNMDAFNTHPTDQIFIDRTLHELKDSNAVFSTPATVELPYADKLNSLYYWADYIGNKYRIL
jgi:asparagine synthetase B (glutamine-hydrolysing)